MSHIFFGSWEGIGRVALMSAVTYLLVITALRVFGAEALAKMSGYDLVVTITLGSLVANVVMSADFSLSEGFSAILTFLLLQEITRRLQKRFMRVHHLVRERPRLAVWDGHFIPENLDSSKITEDEVRAAIRRTGLLSLTQVQAVILENDGEWSVIPRSDTVDISALHGIRVPGRPDEGREDEANDAWPAGTAPRERENAGRGDDRQPEAVGMQAQSSPV